ncbi:diacylglycerol kinase accessory domain protein, partial [Ancylostoma duodenale]
LLNKLLFFSFGTKDVFTRTCKGLHDKISLYLDDQLVELPGIEGIVFLNIQCWGAGVQPWKYADDERPQKLDDGVFEVFFPIDAYAQTIQLNAIGFNKTVKIFDGNGNEQPSMVILSDPTTGWDILEVRKQCDKEWDQVDQYCIRFEARQFTYEEADRFCHDAGGSLIDDLSEAKHHYLLKEGDNFDFWIGLTNPNGSGWVWDRPDGTPMLPHSLRIIMLIALVASELRTTCVKSASCVKCISPLNVFHDSNI